MGTKPAKPRRWIAPCGGSVRAGTCASPAHRRGWISTTCCWVARPASLRARGMNDENQINDAENPIADVINAAEDIPDPLYRLVENSAIDPGAAFTPAVLEGLATLKK